MIEVKNLEKAYGAHQVLKGLSFKAEPGHVTGFVGANGAGKSTTMKIIAGFETADGGEAVVDGKPFAVAQSPTHVLGCCMGPEFLPMNMTGADYLQYLCNSAGLKGVDIEEALGSVGLGGAGNRKIKDYSTGMKQRIGIAAALLGNPDNLMLDEPVNGLDVDGIIWMRDLLRAQAAAGKTVLLSSHLMSELEQVADRVVMLKDGVVVQSGEINSMASDTGAEGLSVLIRSDELTEVRTLLQGADISFDEAQDALLVHGVEAKELGRMVYAEGFSLNHLETHRRSLEDIFLDAKEAGNE